MQKKKKEICVFPAFLNNLNWRLTFRNLMTADGRHSLKNCVQLKKQGLKITQLEKVKFIKVNELKSTQLELFYLFRLMSVAANAFELFCMAHLANIEIYYTIQIFHFKYRILYTCKLASLS